MTGLRLEAKTLSRLPAAQRRHWRVRLLGLNGATVAIAIAGVGLITRRFGGMLWLLLTILTGLVWSTYNAWNLTVAAAERHRDTL